MFGGVVIHIEMDSSRHGRSQCFWVDTRAFAWSSEMCAVVCPAIQSLRYSICIQVCEWNIFHLPLSKSGVSQHIAKVGEQQGQLEGWLVESCVCPRIQILLCSAWGKHGRRIVLPSFDQWLWLPVHKIKVSKKSVAPDREWREDFRGHANLKFRTSQSNFLVW